MTAYSQAVMWQLMENILLPFVCSFFQRLWEMQNYFKYSNFKKTL